MESKSWVIIEKRTGRAVYETFNKDILKNLNSEKYKWFSIYDYLTSLNKKLKESEQ